MPNPPVEGWKCLFELGLPQRLTKNFRVNPLALLRSYSVRQASFWCSADLELHILMRSTESYGFLSCNSTAFREHLFWYFGPCSSSQARIFLYPLEFIVRILFQNSVPKTSSFPQSAFQNRLLPGLTIPLGTWILTHYFNLPWVWIANGVTKQLTCCVEYSRCPSHSSAQFKVKPGLFPIPEISGNE